MMFFWFGRTMNQARETGAVPSIARFAPNSTISKDVTQLALCDASIDLMRHHNIGCLGNLGKLFERSGSLLLSKA
jgi:hypothetical protein